MPPTASAVPFATFSAWGEPLAETRKQIDRINDEAAKAGRKEPSANLVVTFRPIIAETDELAWERRTACSTA